MGVTVSWLPGQPSGPESSCICTPSSAHNPYHDPPPQPTSTDTKMTSGMRNPTASTLEETALLGTSADRAWEHCISLLSALMGKLRPQHRRDPPPSDHTSRWECRGWNQGFSVQVSPFPLTCYEYWDHPTSLVAISPTHWPSTGVHWERSWSSWSGSRGEFWVLGVFGCVWKAWEGLGNSQAGVLSSLDP